ncbi:MAG: hypothetical protein ACFFD1_04650 [Candidatus Thorarchaeota archaeon]
MDYEIDFPCSEVVQYLIHDYIKIEQNPPIPKKNWRQLGRSEKVTNFKKNLATDFIDRFKNSEEVKLSLYFENDVMLSSFKNDTVFFYHPSFFIALYYGNICLRDILEQLKRKGIFIDLKGFVDVIFNFYNLINRDFKLKEVELMKLVVYTRNKVETLHSQFLTFKQAGKILGIRKEQAKTYWYNLLFHILCPVAINHSSLGLDLVFISHKRKLTDFEERFVRISVYWNKSYFTLIFVPKSSDWLQSNELEDENFVIYGKVTDYEENHFLNFLNPKMIDRWGQYPGVNTNRPLKTSLVAINLQTDSRFPIQKKDLEIIDLILIDVGRLKETAQALNVSESYLNQRLKIMVKKEIIFPSPKIENVGLDCYYIFVLQGIKNSQILERITNNLRYFPSIALFKGKDFLVGRIYFPQKWLRQYLNELDDLFGPGGYLEEETCLAFTKEIFSRGTIIHYQHFSSLIKKNVQFDDQNIWDLE